MPEYFGLFLGLAVGVVAGVFGVGGGIVLVPALVYIFKLTQHQAQGTSLAVFVAPIGLLGALRYYYSGNANIHLAAFLAVGLFVGAYFGATLVQPLPGLLMKRLFGGFLLIVSLHMIFSK